MLSNLGWLLPNQEPGDLLTCGKKSECRRQNDDFYEKNIREYLHDLGGMKRILTQITKRTNPIGKGRQMDYTEVKNFNWSKDTFKKVKRPITD